jgi:hypothetical protein
VGAHKFKNYYRFPGYWVIRCMRCGRFDTVFGGRGWWGDTGEAYDYWKDKPVRNYEKKGVKK